MVPRDHQKAPKWCQNGCLKSSKFWKNEKCEILWKPQYLLCFWEVGTSEFSRFSIQKSSEILSAIQAWFLIPQITERIKKLPKMVSNGGPQIHQKSSKISSGTLWAPHECICAPLGHQNGVHGPPRGPKMVPWRPKKTQNSIKNPIYSKHIYISNFTIWFQPCKLFFLFLPILAVSKSEVN